MKVTFSEYMNLRKCPFCLESKESLVFYDPYVSTQNIVFRKVECADCGESWSEVFHLELVLKNNSKFIFKGK